VDAARPLYLPECSVTCGCYRAWVGLLACSAVSAFELRGRVSPAA